DDVTVQLTTKEPDSFLPINLTNLFMASPAKWQKLYDAAQGADAKAKSQAAWAAFARDASGTGPWKMSSFNPRERLELAKNQNYWDKARVPKLDKMLLLPMPEANARTAALLSGQIDWIEAPAPDAVAEIKQRGFLLQTNEEPHVWPWQFSRVEGSPWNDIRGQGPDLGLGLRPDAAITDERVSAAGAGRMLFRRPARRDRMEYTVYQLAARRQGSVRQRRQRDERHLCGDGPVLCAGALSS